MEIHAYRNFILGDPFLDFMNINCKKFGYKKDCDYDSFDPELLLDNYIKQNKKKMISLISSDIGRDFQEYECSIGKVDLIIKTSKLHKHFKNGNQYTGSGYSLITIEYCKLNINKSGVICDYPAQQKYYKYKNWMLKQECIKNNIRVDYSFILARRYTGVDTYDTLFENKGEYSSLKKEIETHFETLKNRGYVLGKNIFPNMKNKNDYPWHNAKKKIAERIREITLLRGIGPKVRDTYIKNGIVSYSQLNLPIVTNKKPLHYEQNVMLHEGANCLFVDFEILTSIYDDFKTYPKANQNTVLFNIGCGYESRGGFRFNSYIAHAIEEEKEVVSKFINFIDKLKGDSCTIFHWTHIERYILKRKLLQYNIKPNKEILWFDLYEFFRTNNVMVKGCYNYKLKYVARMLRKHNLIHSKWDNTFSDGLGAMTGYIKYLKTNDKRIINDIAHYNMIDCKVLWEIWTLFKEKNVHSIR
jgi:hypothetical protein